MKTGIGGKKYSQTKKVFSKCYGFKMFKSNHLPLQLRLSKTEVAVVIFDNGRGDGDLQSMDQAVSFLTARSMGMLGL